MNKYIGIFVIILFNCSECFSADTGQDTLSITVGNDTILQFSKAEINDIINSFPDFFQNPQNPYILYSCLQNHTYFGGEVGQDYYFLLYAHFMKQRNGSEYEQQRKKLIKIYRCINSLYQLLQSGGTYFGHQEFRIIGYAEYSVYLYKSNISERINWGNIDKQKELYIESLRQTIEDMAIMDSFIDIREKEISIKRMNGIVDELNSLITTLFYLKRAQEFQYSHYEYY